MATTEESITRVYTINLGKAWVTPQYRRTDRVVNLIREFAIKHMKSDDIKLDQDLNRQVWSRGKTNPPRKVRVKMVKDEDGVVTVSSYEELPEGATSTSGSSGTVEAKESDTSSEIETKVAEGSKEEETKVEKSSK
jgi:large subunit ribosomal protein L31e